MGMTFMIGLNVEKSIMTAGFMSPGHMIKSNKGAFAPSSCENKILSVPRIQVPGPTLVTLRAPP